MFENVVGTGCTNWTLSQFPETSLATVAMLLTVIGSQMSNILVMMMDADFLPLWAISCTVVHYRSQGFEQMNADCSFYCVAESTSYWVILWLSQLFYLAPVFQPCLWSQAEVIILQSYELMWWVAQLLVFIVHRVAPFYTYCFFSISFMLRLRSWVFTSIAALFTAHVLPVLIIFLKSTRRFFSVS